MSLTNLLYAAAAKVSSDKAQDKYLHLAPMSESYPIPTQVNESAAYLIEKMLNPDSVKQIMMQKTKGCSEDRIRRKTVILSPKDEFVIDRRKTVVLSPNEEFPDNVSETGTYTLDLDKPNTEAEAARTNIDKAFGVVNGEKSAHNKIVSEHKCDKVATNVQVSMINMYLYFLFLNLNDIFIKASSNRFEFLTFFFHLKVFPQKSCYNIHLYIKRTMCVSHFACQ